MLIDTLSTLGINILHVIDIQFVKSRSNSSAQLENMFNLGKRIVM